ncbi:7-cyano-7-deazaguanine synthase [Aerosakkonemataceae cyanobacterium BLCC-F50]|uniref:7-cyano-7-deazaguanine synthase n=1 Tax=Floridaenema flaviceps BLCC-F50 TaxID=3153642 RepID=A0ABV4XRN2_9CYAN
MKFIVEDKDTLVMLSAGMESTIMLHALKKRLTSRLGAIFINVGQYSAERQLSYAKKVCNELGVPLEYIDIPNLRNLLIAYSEPPYETVTEGGLDERIPRGSCMIQTMCGIHAAYHKYEYVYYGGTKSDISRVPNLPLLVSTVETVIRLNTGIQISVKAPFIEMEDDDVLQLGLDEGINLSESWSCTWGNLYHCGECERCQKRKSVFARLGLADPTRYMKEREISKLEALL